jgi:phosphohistidine phosphatase SixA
MIRYVLLARHGAATHDAGKPDSEQQLVCRGKDVREVASRLADHLRVQPPGDEPIVIGEIWLGSYRQVGETARILYDTLKRHVGDFDPQQVRVCCLLDPERFRLATSKEERHRVARWLLDGEDYRGHPNDFGPNLVSQAPARPNQPEPNAILVVGHAPQIGWTAEKLLGRPQPIDRGELLCIAISDSRRDRLSRRSRWLAWAISPSDDKTMEALVAKIEAKRRLAALLGGLITGLWTFLLQTPLKEGNWLEGMDAAVRRSVYASAVLMLLALGLYLAAMYSYDRLTMPTRFWAEKAAPRKRRWLVQRPPSPSSWVLYQNMIRVWNRLFTPATLAFVLGLVVLAYAAFQPGPWILVGAIPLVLLFAWYWWRSRPVLGTED